MVPTNSRSLVEVLSPFCEELPFLNYLIHTTSFYVPGEYANRSPSAAMDINIPLHQQQFEAGMTYLAFTWAAAFPAIHIVIVMIFGVALTNRINSRSSAITLTCFFAITICISVVITSLLVPWSTTEIRQSPLGFSENDHDILYMADRCVDQGVINMITCALTTMRTSASAIYMHEGFAGFPWVFWQLFLLIFVGPLLMPISLVPIICQPEPNRRLNLERDEKIGDGKV
ncbi:hypothetical protein Slin14017_G120150 [Septoria linicola]|nr:hypothetical protein Slin14017_G120150 [Septoria linicola]